MTERRTTRRRSRRKGQGEWNKRNRCPCVLSLSTLFNTKEEKEEKEEEK